MAASWAPPLNLSPVTDDVDQARTWFEINSAAGIEGLVVKDGAQPYRGGARSWLKVKHRSTLDVVCGALTGPRSQPRELVVGLPIAGTLRVMGRTTLLSPGGPPPAGASPCPGPGAQRHGGRPSTRVRSAGPARRPGAGSVGCWCRSSWRCGCAR
ncbi:hypothetical protein H9623_18390 [Oerskovia sp. Sa1BUA8]|uniref:ATP-dependent DNA ligase family profile domain-containing protein n=1 Tax=Oerskovia douganii TaxID=2762210 RepID=A0A9D5Z1G5_9CELL|nr:hypothetical protein [Oerskovia douganii]